MKKEYLYGVMGLVIGVLVTLIFTLSIGNSDRPGLSMVDDSLDSKDSGAHMMPDGTIMNNEHDMTMDDMVNMLRGKSGDDFDKAFIEGMIEHHQGAIDMSILAENQSGKQEIKDLASDIIEDQKNEINMMLQWQKSWGY